VATDAFDEQVSGIAALDHRISRQAYRLVGEHHWVSRDEAAERLGVGRSVAAFHLDKLVAAGLLTVRYERVSGRTGPGAGRPAKLYGRSDREFEVSLPPRRYDLAGSLLAGAIARAESEGIAVGAAVDIVAREVGERIGAASARKAPGPGEASAGAASSPGKVARAAAAPSAREAAAQPASELAVLAAQGYEPQLQGAEIALANCPFHSLAAEHRALVCRMNLAFITGLLDGLGETRLSARLAPEAGFCCVRLGPDAGG
jgi:predicted ArsR family transcriptional regulator